MKSSSKADIYQPEYLSCLDSAPQKSFEDLYNDLSALLSTHPPSPYGKLTNDEKDDLLDDIAYHLVRNNFKVLRKYKNIGRSFWSWLYTVCNNYILDYLRKKNPEVDIESSSESKSSGIENILPAQSTNPSNPDVLSDLLEATNKGIAKLDSLCKVLLEMAADEYTFDEMLVVLKWPSNKMKSLYGKVDYCRKKLKDLLFLDGHDLSAIVRN